MGQWGYEELMRGTKSRTRKKTFVTLADTTKVTWSHKNAVTTADL